MVCLGVYSACTCPISVSWTLFKSSGLWNKFDLDSKLDKGDQLFKFTGKFKYLGIKNLPQEFLKENCSITVEFQEDKTQEVKRWHVCYLLQKLKMFCGSTCW